MAKKDDPKAGVLSLTRLLISAADGDTLFRDLYLQHAEAQVAEAMPEATYRALCTQRAQIDALTRQTQVAVQSQDWPRVKELSSQVQGLRSTLQQNATLIEVASAVYDAEPVKIDPFSPGLADLTAKTSLVEVRNALVTTFAELAKADPGWADLYTERQEHFKRLAVTEGATKIEKETDSTADLADLQQRARDAAERGEVARLQELAERIMHLSEEAKKAASAAPATAVERPTAPAASRQPRVSTEPFPAPCLAHATALGLEHVCVQAQFPQMPSALAEFMAQHVWQPHANVEELAKEGAVHLQAKLSAMNVPAEMKEPFVALAALFSLRPFVNSGGMRYFPPEPDEYVLLETFPEDAEPPQSELMTLLGLPRRRGLSRLEIELALQHHGPAVLERLGLPPREFRVVCVPFDIYVRAGRERGWGQQQQWTHVDGYGFTQRARLGALAGGDVRYGGLFDLVILSATDQREGVVARFCIIRRSRMQAAR